MKEIKVSLIHIIVVTLIVAILTAIIVPIVVNNTGSDTAETSDEMTVDHLNEALVADEEINGAPETLCGVWQILESAGYNAEAAPLYNENTFYWYKTANRVVMVTDNKIVYPSAYTSGTVYTNFTNSPFIDFNTLQTDATAHSSEYASGTCSVCGATNPD